MSDAVTLSAVSLPASRRRPWRSRLGLWLLVGNLLVVMVVVGMAALSLLSSRQTMADRALLTTETLARVLEQNIASSIDRVDLALQATRLAYETRLARGVLEEGEFEGVLARLNGLLGGKYISLRVADAQGRVRFGLGEAKGRAVSIADRSYFAQAREQSQPGVIVSEPVRSRATGRWALAVVRRLQHADGRFAGVVLASYELSQFQEIFAPVNLGRSGAISLRTADLQLIARRTAQGPDLSGVGTTRVSEQLLQLLQQSPRSGSYVAKTALDQIERASAYLRVRDLPLIVLVGLGTDDFLAPWRTQRNQVVALVALVLLMMAGLSVLAHRFWRREEQRDRETAAAQVERLAAEREARLLRAQIEERDEFVRVLAHEVRQPLNNASAALQGARAVMMASPSAMAAAQRVRRAETVIGQIVSSLDNTLAATALLASTQRIDGRDADVSVLIELCLGDLDQAERPRVVVERISATRTASMDIGLMRLALRNVLGNALAYSPPGSPVRLCVTDSDEPLALVFEVFDQGMGVAESLKPHLFERGVRGTHQVPGHGIGLYVVRRVMELHGGHVDVRPNEPVGTVFRLWLPQDV